MTFSLTLREEDRVVCCGKLGICVQRAVHLGCPVRQHKDLGRVVVGLQLVQEVGRAFQRVAGAREGREHQVTPREDDDLRDRIQAGRSPDSSCPWSGAWIPSPHPSQLRCRCRRHHPRLTWPGWDIRLP